MLRFHERPIVFERQTGPLFEQGSPMLEFHPEGAGSRLVIPERNTI
jgi:hypothetical protein